jgi:hypothetical protein
VWSALHKLAKGDEVSAKMLEVGGGFEAASATCTSVGLGNPVREWTKEEKRSTKLDCGDRRIVDSGNHG